MREPVEERRRRQAALCREALRLDELAAGRSPLSPTEREDLRGLVDCSRADAILWGLVGEYRGLIYRYAARYRQCAPHLQGESLDAISGILNIGWFRGALRFDPDVGVLFSTYASMWGMSELQRANDRHGAVVLGTRKSRLEGGWSSCPVGTEEELVRLGDGGVSPEEEAGAAEEVRWVGRALDQLPQRDAELLRDVYLRGMLISEAADARGLSRQRVYALAERALGRMRALLDDPTRTR